jgi:hypothetical protein
MKLAAILATSLITSMAIAGDDHEHEGGDYGLTIIDGTVAVGIGDHDEGVVENIGERVFAADMSLSGPNWFADEPGIFIEEGSLPDNTQVGFTLTQSLMYWDGSGAVNFGLAADAMSLSFGPASVSTSLDNSAVAGFSINYDADAVGGFDEHLDYTIDGLAPTGIYLLANTFSLTGALDSDVIFTVFNAGLDENAHDAAIEYAESVLVPAPSAAGLLALAGLGAMSRRRKA